MTDITASDDRTKWGRARFGGGRIPAMAIAIPAGLLLGVGAGAIAIWSDVAGPYPLIGGAGFVLATATAFVALVWALIVDRMSLEGAQDRPDESVESTWLDKATSGAFRDTITLAGLALALIAFTGWKLDAMTALIGVIFVAIVSTAIRYLVAKKRG